MVSKIAAEAHEKFGLTIPSILDAETDGDVAAVLRGAIRDNIASAYAKSTTDKRQYRLGPDERLNLLKINDEAEKYLRDRCLGGVHDAPPPPTR